MAALWLVTPVHGRQDITRVCLEQRAHAVEELGRAGIEARVLVVGDDGNLDAARELGLDVLERPNALAVKLNDGFEWAAREGGASYVAFIGSDDWVHPSFLASLPEADQARTSEWIAFVAPTGDRLIVNRMPGSVGNAPWIVPVGLLEACGHRPFQPERRLTGMDGALARSVSPRLRHARGIERRAAWRVYSAATARLWDHREADELRAVDFKGTREQITPWSAVSGRRSRLAWESDDPWGVLATRYPADLVERMQRLYAEGRA